MIFLKFILVEYEIDASKAYKMIEEGIATSHKQADKMIERQDERVWDVLDKIIHSK